MRRSDFHIVQEQARQRVRYSRSTYVQQCQHLYGIYSMLPDEAAWLYDTGESLVAQLEHRPEPGLLYASIVGDIRALCLTLAWKCREATAASVVALNQRAISAAAMTARGALEAATASIDQLARLASAQQAILKSGHAQEVILTELNRLETKNIRSIWGRKGGTFKADVNANHFFDHQRSILKFAAGNEVYGPEIVELHGEVYATLCSMAHPSADGHQAYWVLPEGNDPPIDTVEIGLQSRPDLRTSYATTLLESILWALGWSAAHATRAWQEAERQHLEAVAALGGEAG